MWRSEVAFFGALTGGKDLFPICFNLRGGTTGQSTWKKFSYEEIDNKTMVQWRAAATSYVW